MNVVAVYQGTTSSGSTAIGNCGPHRIENERPTIFEFNNIAEDIGYRLNLSSVVILNIIPLADED